MPCWQAALARLVRGQAPGKPHVLVSELQGEATGLYVLVETHQTGGRTCAGRPLAPVRAASRSPPSCAHKGALADASTSGSSAEGIGDRSDPPSWPACCAPCGPAPFEWQPQRFVQPIVAFGRAKGCGRGLGAKEGARTG